MFDLISKCIKILDTEITNIGTSSNVFSLSKKDKEKIKKLRNSKLFSEYIVKIKEGNKFEIEAKTKDNDLQTSLLYFENMKSLFDPLGIDSNIQISNGSLILFSK